MARRGQREPPQSSKPLAPDEIFAPWLERTGGVTETLTKRHAASLAFRFFRGFAVLIQVCPSFRRGIAALSLFFGGALSAQAGEVTVFVREGTAPAPNVTLRIDGTELATTGDGGAAVIDLPDGARLIELLRNGLVVHTEGVPEDPQGTLVLTLADAAANPDSTQLDDVVVEAKAKRAEGSVAAVLAQQRAMSEVAEIIGADQFSLAGDADAAAAVQRITGLTIEDDKYVVVRGQPSRYATTLWNGMPLPSPDPSRQIVPLDLFPTSVLASIAVQKSYSADKPGSFGGGAVTLNSRQAPPEPFFQLRAGSGANTAATGKSGLDYDGSNGDVFGYDSGVRDLPDAIARATQGGQQSLDSLTQDERNELGKSFAPIYELTDRDLPPNSGLSLSAGNRIDVGSASLGALASVAWSNTHTLTTEHDRDYRLATGNTLSIERDFRRTRSDLQAQVAGTAALSAEWDDHRLATNTFFIRDTIKRAEFSAGHDDVSNDRFERGSLLEFNQRELMIQQLTGLHDFGGIVLDWAAQYADGTRSSPDRREYKYVRQDDGTYVFWSEFGMLRQFNETSDESTSGALNATVSLLDGDGPFSLLAKAGASSWQQDRRSNTQRFRFEPIGNPPELALQNPEDFINPQTIGTIVDFFDDTQGVDDYAGDADIRGAYLQLDAGFAERLRLVGGARLESGRYRVRTFESKDPGAAIIRGDFDETDLLPALSATWFVSPATQLRAALSETVSRPLLIELSSTAYVDPDSGLEYVGNPGLAPARIRSFDLRWEWYPRPRETLSAGIFAKDYENPIEQQFQPLAGGGEQITFINGASARVAGVELSGRLTLDRLDWDWLGPAYVQANLAVVDSQVELEDTGIATHTERPLQGQADTVVNLQLGYGLGRAVHWVLSYNRIGERLETAGINGEPDVLQRPLGRLDLGVTYDATSALELKLTANNLLDEDREYVQGGLLERRVEPGVAYAATISYTFSELQ